MIELEEQAYQILEDIKALGSTQRIVSQRCDIILSFRKRKHVELVAQDLGVHENTARKWKDRWLAFLPTLLAQWNRPNFNPKKAILKILKDAKRPGAPPSFTPEQVTEMIVLSCQNPRNFGRPITHWTMKELADEVVKQGIAKSVSESTLRRFLKSARHTSS